MDWYDTALVCSNGHVVNPSMKLSPDFNTKFCKKCGAATLSACPGCNTEIQGYYHMENVVSLDVTSAPSFCHSCGSAYPWTQASLDELKAIASELEGLTDDEKQRLSHGMDDLVRDTPRTESAIMRLKRAAPKLGNEGWDAVKNILRGIATEAVKKSLGL